MNLSNIEFVVGLIWTVIWGSRPEIHHWITEWWSKRHKRKNTKRSKAKRHKRKAKKSRKGKKRRK